MANGYELVGSCSGLQEALITIPDIKPNVVLMDINLGENESGMDCIRELKPLYRKFFS